MYIPKYCNKEGISRKLRGRLNMNIDINVESPYLTSVPGQSVEDELVDQIIEQTEEGFLDLILTQIYIMPLKHEHSILKNIVESIVASELLRIHFQGQGIAQLGGDFSGAGSDLKNYAYGILMMLTVGLNIYIPGQPQISTRDSGNIPQPLYLPGESRRINYQDNDLITNNFVYVGKNEYYKKSHTLETNELEF